MPKTKKPLFDKINELIKGKKEFHLDQDFDDQNKVKLKLLCTVCSEEVKFNHSHGKQRFEEHLTSDKHQKNMIKNKNQRQSSIVNSFQKQPENDKRKNRFFADLTQAFIAANIPFEKLENEKLRKFFFKYMKVNIPNASTLRKNYLDEIYQSKIEKIRKTVAENKVFFVIDDTTDARNRYVLNVLVGILNGGPIEPMLLSTQYLDRVNNTTILQSINRAAQLLWPEGIKYENLILVVTDQATAMIKGIKAAKELYPNINHITCLSHALHRVCEFVRNKNPLVDQFISSMKKILKKSPLRRQNFKEMCNISLPPNPIITRWGSWLKTAFYYIENYDLIYSFIRQLKDENNSAIKKAKELISKNDLKNQLLQLSAFKFLPERITELQKSSLKMSEQLEILEGVKKNLSGIYLDKLNNSLLKNPDLVRFTSEDNSMDHRIKSVFAPLVSVEVERSFSTYKIILTERRFNLSESNIEKLLVVQFNSFLD